jgi:hypothetical protein
VNKNDTIEESEEAEKIGIINYYWVVPRENKSSWKGKAPKTISAQEGTGKEEKRKPFFTNANLKEWLAKYIKQYVLVMSEEPVRRTVKLE